MGSTRFYIKQAQSYSETKAHLLNIFHGENFECGGIIKSLLYPHALKHSSPAVYYCDILYFDNCVFRKVGFPFACFWAARLDN